MIHTTKAGTYKVVYQVEDGKGAKSTKIINVIVMANEDTENKNEEDNIEEDNPIKRIIVMQNLL